MDAQFLREAPFPMAACTRDLAGMALMFCSVFGVLLLVALIHSDILELVPELPRPVKSLFSSIGIAGVGVFFGSGREEKRKERLLDQGKNGWGSGLLGFPQVASWCVGRFAAAAIKGGKVNFSLSAATHGASVLLFVSGLKGSFIAQLATAPFLLSYQVTFPLALIGTSDSDLCSWMRVAATLVATRCGLPFLLWMLACPQCFQFCVPWGAVVALVVAFLPAARQWQFSTVLAFYCGLTAAAALLDSCPSVFVLVSALDRIAAATSGSRGLSLKSSAAAPSAAVSLPAPHIRWCLQRSF